MPTSSKSRTSSSGSTPLLPTPPPQYSLFGNIWSSRNKEKRLPTVVIQQSKKPQLPKSLMPASNLQAVVPLLRETTYCGGREIVHTKKTRIGQEIVNADLKNTFLTYSVDDLNPPQQKPLSRSLSVGSELPTKTPVIHHEGGCPSYFSSQPRITTYMIRNIPTRFTSISFIKLLEEYGFSKTFDFFYLPMDFRSGKNMGYAFINFKIPETGVRFVDTFNAKRLPVSTSRKILEVYPSRRQGLLENVSLFKSSDLLTSSVSLPYYKPLVATEDGNLVPLSDINFLVQ